MMNGDTLAASIWTAIKAQSGATYTAEQDALGLEYWKLIAGEIVDHIQSAAVVTVTGVTPGGGSANGTVD